MKNYTPTYKIDEEVELTLKDTVYRGQVKAVTFTEEGEYYTVASFLPSDEHVAIIQNIPVENLTQSVIKA